MKNYVWARGAGTLAGALALALLLGGCTGGDPNARRDSATDNPRQAQQQIEKIQNDPNIPAEAKAAAIAAMQQGQAAANNQAAAKNQEAPAPRK